MTHAGRTNAPPAPPCGARASALGDVDPFRPSRTRPVRVRARTMPADSYFEPHRHGGYASESAATAMFKAAPGHPPSHFGNQMGRQPASRLGKQL